MSKLDRRIFLVRTLAAGVAAAATGAQAQGALVDEKEPQAVAIGYRSDTNKVDGKKYAQHKASQSCSNCQLFSGKASDATGPCAVFPGKHVAAQGWCSAWVAKAG